MGDIGDIESAMLAAVEAQVDADVVTELAKKLATRCLTCVSNGLKTGKLRDSYTLLLKVEKLTSNSTSNNNYFKWHERTRTKLRKRCFGLLSEFELKRLYPSLPSRKLMTLIPSNAHFSKRQIDEESISVSCVTPKAVSRSEYERHQNDPEHSAPSNSSKFRTSAAAQPFASSENRLRRARELQEKSDKKAAVHRMQREGERDRAMKKLEKRQEERQAEEAEHQERLRISEIQSAEKQRVMRQRQIQLQKERGLRLRKLGEKRAREQMIKQQEEKGGHPRRRTIPTNEEQIPDQPSDNFAGWHTEGHSPEPPCPKHVAVQPQQQSEFAIPTAPVLAQPVPPPVPQGPVLCVPYLVVVASAVSRIAEDIVRKNFSATSSARKPSFLFTVTQEDKASIRNLHACGYYASRITQVELLQRFMRCCLARGRLAVRRKRAVAHVRSLFRKHGTKLEDVPTFTEPCKKQPGSLVTEVSNVSWGMREQPQARYWSLSLPSQGLHKRSVRSGAHYSPQTSMHCATTEMAIQTDDLVSSLGTSLQCSPVISPRVPQATQTTQTQAPEVIVERTMVINSSTPSLLAIESVLSEHSVGSKPASTPRFEDASLHQVPSLVASLGTCLTGSQSETGTVAASEAESSCTRAVSELEGCLFDSKRSEASETQKKGSMSVAQADEETTKVISGALKMLCSEGHRMSFMPAGGWACKEEGCVYKGAWCCEPCHTALCDMHAQVRLHASRNSLRTTSSNGCDSRLSLDIITSYTPDQQLVTNLLNEAQACKTEASSPAMSPQVSPPTETETSSLVDGLLLEINRHEEALKEAKDKEEHDARSLAASVQIQSMWRGYLGRAEAMSIHAKRSIERLKEHKAKRIREEEEWKAKQARKLREAEERRAEAAKREKRAPKTFTEQDLEDPEKLKEWQADYEQRIKEKEIQKIKEEEAIRKLQKLVREYLVRYRARRKKVASQCLGWQLRMTGVSAARAVSDSLRLVKPDPINQTDQAIAATIRTIITNKKNQEIRGHTRACIVQMFCRFCISATLRSQLFQTRASTCIQKIWRGHCGRVLGQKMVGWGLRKITMERSVRTIQRMWRGWAVRKTYLQHKTAVCKEEEEEEPEEEKEENTEKLEQSPPQAKRPQTARPVHAAVGPPASVKRAVSSASASRPPTTLPPSIRLRTVWPPHGPKPSPRYVPMVTIDY